MAGERARVVIASALLLSMTGCQSWFYYPRADVLSKWEEFRKEGRRAVEVGGVGTELLFYPCVSGDPAAQARSDVGQAPAPEAIVEAAARR